MHTLLRPTLAHAGTHDLSTGDGVLHALTAPGHLLAAAACIFGAYVAFFVYRRLASRKPQAVRESIPTPSARGQG